ncbi:MAG TPA: Do family serine endopeptidase [Candidatus Binatia bacterium]|nr:Do family serine endopeptidase [Candidatus Binatia bacterium]
MRGSRKNTALHLSWIAELQRSVRALRTRNPNPDALRAGRNLLSGENFFSRLNRSLLAVIFASSFAACQESKPADTAAPTAPAEKAEASGSAGAPRNSYAGVVDNVAPTVVTIRSEKRVRAPRQHPFFNDPFLRDFFGGLFQGGPPVLQRPQIGLGSGVIVKPDGYIVTNHHVVDGAAAIKIETADHRIFDAKVIGSDPPSDLAVLKIDADKLPVLSLANSDKARVGDVVLAVGNPLGIGQTVTAGILSAKGRATGLSDGSFEDFLQTDAPINQGNSGGALVNASGELIGINSQILSPTGGNIGIGFAIPANMVSNVMEQLIKNGKVERGALGIGIQPVTPDIASSLGLKESRGVIVNSVTPNSAAARAGIRQGDVIKTFDGEPVLDGNSLRNRVARTAPETEVKITVIRDGKETELSAKLGEYRPPETRNVG